MCCKEGKVKTAQPTHPPRPPIHISELDGDALAAELFSTSRNPNRRRAPPQDSRANSSTPRYTASERAALEIAAMTIARLRPQGVQQSTPASPVMYGHISQAVRTGRGQEHSGHRRNASTDTLPLYEPQYNPVVMGDRSTTASSDCRRGSSGTVRRTGTGWSAVSQSSGPPPSYHSTEWAQGTGQSARG